MSRKVFLRFVVGLAAVWATPWVRAQDALISELYGRGIHAFFARDYAEAHKQFTASIEQGSSDPRCYYFRGLASGKLGRPEECEADIKQGAALELANPEQLHDVSKSLQRIQGTGRIAIEKQRASVRFEAAKRAKALRDAMYEQWKHDEGKVIRQPQTGRGSGAANPAASGPSTKVATPQAAGQTAPKAKPAPTKTEDEDPFGESEPTPKPKADSKPPAKTDDDPFG